MNSDGWEKTAGDISPAEFFYRFLEIRGAALERTADGFHAMLPEELRSILQAPELAAFQTNRLSDADEPDSGSVLEAAEGRYTVHYGAPLLDRAVSEVCGRVPVLSYQLHFDYIKTQGFQELIRRQFTFSNAVGSLESHALFQARYLVITAWYSALSDEQKEGLATLAFNLENGACVPEIADLLEGTQRTADTAGPEANGEDIRDVLSGAAAAFRKYIAAEITDFQESMNRRFQRDVQNLTEYYEGLEREMEKSLERPGLSRQLIQDREEKIRLIPEELDRKKDDLHKKYSIKIHMRPCAMIHVRTPAVKLRHRLSIGKSTRTLSMTYNPATKAMDPLVCEECGASTYGCTFDEACRLLCRECAKRPHPPIEKRQNMFAGRAEAHSVIT